MPVLRRSRAARVAMNNMNAIQSGHRWVPNEPAVVSETVDDETIVIHLESGCYYSLMGTAAES